MLSIGKSKSIQIAKFFFSNGGRFAAPTTNSLIFVELNSTHELWNVLHFDVCVTHGHGQGEKKGGNHKYWLDKESNLFYYYNPCGFRVPSSSSFFWLTAIFTKF